ncbi:MAG: AAA family ATPase [Sulfurovaceae bacterium]
MSEIIEKIAKDLSQKKAKIKELKRLEVMLSDELLEEDQVAILQQEIEKLIAEINKFASKKSLKKDKKTEDFFASLDIKYDEIESHKLEFLMDDFIIKNEITMLVARPATGKSLIAVSTCNMLMLEQKVKQVYYLDNDNSRVTLRSRNVHGFQLVFGDKFRYFANLEDGDFIRIVDTLKKVDLTDTIVVFDSITNFIVGDRNNHADVAKMLKDIKNLRNNNATVLFLHHQSKLNKDFNSDFAGSSAFLEDISCAFKLMRNDDKNALVLNVIKDRNHILNDVAFVYNSGNTLTKLDLQFACETNEDIEMRDVISNFITSCKQNRPTYTEIMKFMVENGYVNKDKVNRIIQMYKNKSWIAKKQKSMNNRDVFELIDSPDKSDK